MSGGRYVDAILEEGRCETDDADRAAAARTIREALQAPEQEDEVLDSFERLFRAPSCDGVTWVAAGDLLARMALDNRRAASLVSAWIRDRTVASLSRFGIVNGMSLHPPKGAGMPDELLSACLQILDDPSDDACVREAVVVSLRNHPHDACEVTESLVNVGLRATESVLLRRLALVSPIHAAEPLTPRQVERLANAAATESDSLVREYLIEAVAGLGPSNSTEPR